MKDQNWFAVALDFIIVVVGVFFELQVSNWNEAKTFNKKETTLLYKLKKQMENTVIITNNKIDNYNQVSAAVSDLSTSYQALYRAMQNVGLF